jgi:hypothetical protein
MKEIRKKFSGSFVRMQDGVKGFQSSGNSINFKEIIGDITELK